MVEVGPTRAVVLWTGGKDSALALHAAAKSGCRIVGLATFVPAKGEFLAHSRRLIALQAQALQLPHRFVPIMRPYRRSYEKALAGLKARFQADAVITGDIGEVAGLPNWIQECCQGLGLRVITPLWGQGRGRLLDQLIDSGIQAVFTCVKKPWLDAGWLERRIDAKALRDLKILRRKTGLDLCGEQGEYHTMTIGGPMFKKSIQLDALARRRRGNVFYLRIDRARLVQAS